MKEEKMSEHPVYDAILARRSIRSFLDTPVERGQIEILLKAAMAAPSACNLQPWAFIVVDEAETLGAVKAATTQGQYNAPLAIVVCGVYKHIPWEGEGWMQDCGAAAQNMMLAATELGLASVCVGGFDEDLLCKILDIPDDVQPLCIIEFGYPAYHRKSRTWYTEEAVHWQKFDQSKKRTMRTLQMLQDDIATER
ncbi:MAG: nitroreductase family protein [Lachnospiraceae bacterium]|nr:nitroreductase family protein [Lachnospiraceae bacterium]